MNGQWSRAVILVRSSSACVASGWALEGRPSGQCLRRMKASLGDSQRPIWIAGRSSSIVVVSSKSGLAHVQESYCVY